MLRISRSFSIAKACLKQAQLHARLLSTTPELPEAFFSGKGLGRRAKGGVETDVEVDTGIRENIEKYIEGWSKKDFEESDKAQDILRNESNVDTKVLNKRWRALQNGED